MRKVVLYISFLVIFNNVFAQKDSLNVQYDESSVELKKFDTNQLEDYRADKDFIYEVQKSQPSIFSRIWDWFKRVLTKFFSWLFGVNEAIGIVQFIIQILPYVILLLVLIVILKFFLMVDMKNLITGKVDKSSVLFTEDEEIINNKNINSLIEQAIKQKNYRLAVRYYYLLVLQKLQKKDLIDWQQQKTNEDYINEIQQKTLTDKFKNLTYLYDFVWYGNFEINELEFAKVESNFNDLTTSIK
jgi:hypothetical protein